MDVNHLGIFVSDLNGAKSFFERFFGFTSGEKYTNPLKKFSSYLLTSDSGKFRIEIMHKEDVKEKPDKDIFTGLHHLSFTVGSDSAVDDFAERLASEGYEILDGPRRTGDGYYECCIRVFDEILIEVCSGSLNNCRS